MDHGMWAKLDAAGRQRMGSPGGPPVARREQRQQFCQQFWEARGSANMAVANTIPGAVAAASENREAGVNPARSPAL